MNEPLSAGQPTHLPGEAVLGVPRAYGVATFFEALVGLSALSGGLTLALNPDGGAMQLSVTQLSRSPFSDYLVPGVLLAVVVGGANLLASVLSVSQHRWSRAASLVAGLSLVGYVGCEVLMFPASPLQVVAGALGLIIVALALPRRG